MSTLLIAGGSALVSSMLLVGAIRAYAVRWELMDLPNERSSHAIPTPRGGGAGVIIALVVVFVIAAWTERVIAVRLVVAIAGVVFVAAVGWKDDLAHLSVRLRLTAHVLAAATLIPLILSPAPTPLWLMGLTLCWWLFWAVSSINVANFMDGIDGLIASQFLLFGLHLVVRSWAGHRHTTAELLGIAMLGACAGFLYWNWSPARIFLGDVGSGALGLIAVLGGALLVRDTETGFIAAFLPLYPLFLDATVTLIRRVLRGERITEAHRSHLYQRLGNGRLGHPRTTLIYAAGAACGVVVASTSRTSQWFYVLAAYIFAVLVTGATLNRWVTRAPAYLPRDDVATR